MHTYCFRMGATLCEIEVEARPVTNGPAVYVAFVFISEDDERVLRPIWRRAATGPLEILRSSEDEAVTQMGSFLEKAFGPGEWPIRLCSSSDQIQTVGEKWLID